MTTRDTSASRRAVYRNLAANVISPLYERLDEATATSRRATSTLCADPTTANVATSSHGVGGRVAGVEPHQGVPLRAAHRQPGGLRHRVHGRHGQDRGSGGGQ